MTHAHHVGFQWRVHPLGMLLYTNVCKEKKRINWCCSADVSPPYTDHDDHDGVKGLLYMRYQGLFYSQFTWNIDSSQEKRKLYHGPRKCITCQALVLWGIDMLWWCMCMVVANYRALNQGVVNGVNFLLCVESGEFIGLIAFISRGLFRYV